MMETLKKTKNKLLLVIGIFIASLVVVVSARIDRFARPDEPVPAFPGAMGFGSMTAGGRFGRIVIFLLQQEEQVVHFFV